MGKESFGDIEVNKDESALYAVNLNDRKLYRIPTSGALNNATITSVAIPSITGCAADTRPFALSKDALERLHVGAICSAETGGTISAQVWRYDESTSTFASVYAGNPFGYGGGSDAWAAWSVNRTRQPWLTDLRFDGDFTVSWHPRPLARYRHPLAITASRADLLQGLRRCAVCFAEWCNLYD